MGPFDIWKTIKDIAEADGRYAPEAFFLVQEALERTVRLAKSGRLASSAADPGPRSTGDDPEEFHVSGQELLEGFRVHVREEFGNMGLFLLRRLGLRRCEDVGEIVFALVESEAAFRKRECDSREDFSGGYDFAAAFAPEPILEIEPD